MTKTTMSITRPQNGTREVRLDILIYFLGQLSKSIVSSPSKTTYTISGNIVGNGTVPRKMTIYYKETLGKTALTVKEVDGTFIEEIIIEESDTDSIITNESVAVSTIGRKIIIEESDTDSIIIEESDTDSIIITIPRGKAYKSNGVPTSSDVEGTSVI